MNLCLTGNAVSNVFDGVMELDSGGPSKVKSYFCGLKFVRASTNEVSVQDYVGLLQVYSMVYQHSGT